MLKKKEAKEAKKRHLHRALKHIDKSQIQPESRIFKTISRDKARKTYYLMPEGTEVGRYNPEIK